MVKNDRTKRALQMITKIDSVLRVGKNNYRVRSQSQDKFYRVRKLSNADVWLCECEDFMYQLWSGKDKRCKHILACQILQESLEVGNKIEKVEQPKICPKCLSTTIIKIGFRIVKSGIKRRRYRCKQCTYKFVLGENGFGKVQSDPKLITEALNLIFSGMTYRNTSRHIEISHNTKISHVSILNWHRKYTQIMKEYVDQIMPEASEVWSVDEMMLNVKNTKPIKAKGFYDWMWSIIDPQSKFVVASEISKKREIADARKIFESGKKITKVSPSYVITDALHSYDDAFRKAFDDRKTAHIKTKSLSDGFANRPIERYHNELRAVTKAKRGLGNDKSAQEFADGYRIYHNFCRPHSGLNNKTPAEVAGINLNLGTNKIHDLIVKSTQPKNFATQLGKRITHVIIVNEKDSIKVTPKTWLEKQTWREINDILSLNGFSWLPNGKDGCWLKLLHDIHDKGTQA